MRAYIFTYNGRGLRVNKDLLFTCVTVPEWRLYNNSGSSTKQTLPTIWATMPIHQSWAIVDADGYGREASKTLRLNAIAEP